MFINNWDKYNTNNVYFYTFTIFLIQNYHTILSNYLIYKYSIPTINETGLIGETMANDLLEDDQEMVDETPNNLKDFHMSELLELIENTINNEEYDIELFIRKIHDF